MTKPWTDTGLSDFQSWLGITHPNDGLIYRGDGDFEQLGPRGMLTLIEFKNAGEPLGRGQLNWLRRRGHDERTEVRVVREHIDPDKTDPHRIVFLWDPMRPEGWIECKLSDLAEWVNSRAYRSGSEHPTNLPRRAKP